MKRDEIAKRTHALRTLSTEDLQAVGGGEFATDGGGSGGGDGYAWIPATPPTIPDIGWDSYFWFA